MTPLKKRMKEELVLRGYSDQTIDIYLLQVARLARHFNRSPDGLDDEQLRAYVLHLHERGLGYSSINQAVSAMRFFYVHVLGRLPDSLVGALPRTKSALKRPRVYSPGQISQLLSACDRYKHRVFFSTLYSAGLRVDEACHLRPEAIDSARMQIRVEKGKGKKERHTLLSETLLEELRRYHHVYRPQQWLFYGRSPEIPLSSRTIQIAFKKLVKRAGLPDKGGPHSLRHSFATHLLESGVEITIVQRLLGHANVKTTMGYLHVRDERLAQVRSPLDRLGLPAAPKD